MAAHPQAGVWYDDEGVQTPPARGALLRQPHDAELCEANVGAGRAMVPSQVVRVLVSRKKRRFVHDSVNLDLSYITNRIIAMGYPSAGLEGWYRNPVTAVKRFLDARHPFHYRIWNLCSERSYPEGIFNAEIERFAWDDHTPPPLALMLPACESMDAWLHAHASNVAVVHCKAGKGRTGTIIAAYLLLADVNRTADEVMHFFGVRRTHDGKGVTIASQKRFVAYFALQAAALRIFAPHQALVHPGTLSPASLSHTAATSGSEAGRSVGGAAASAGGLTAAGIEMMAVVMPRRTSGDVVDGGFASSSGVAGGTLPINRAVAAAPPAPDSAVAATPPSFAYATSVVTGKEKGGERVMVTFDVSCAADGSYGFFIDQNAAAAPIVSRVLVPPTGPDGASSVLLPTGGKHLQDALHVGDLLVSINNAPLAHRPFTEVVSMFANATLPITLRVSRAAPTTTKSRAASGAGAGLLAATAGEEVVTLPATGAPESHVAAYLRNVASAIGIWSPIANVRDVPHVPVALLAVHISHVPALKKKLSCCKGTPSSADFYVQVFGGHGCKTLLYDSRAPTGGTALGRGSSAPSPAVVAGAGAGVNAAEERLLERVGSSAARASHRRLQSDSAALSWSIPPGVVMHSDYRVVVCVAGRKKPLFGVWAHTAGLPLPYAARAALPKRVQLAPEVAVNMSAAPSAGASAVAGAAATPVAPITAAGDADTPAVSSPTLASLHGVTLDSSAAEGATAAAASLSSVSVQPFVDDVTFGIVRPGMPSAGALFTALPSHAAADVATSPAAPVRMYDTRAARQVARSSCVFVKSQLDGASKDKKHKRFDATLQLRLDYTILGLPPIYFEAVPVPGGL